MVMILKPYNTVTARSKDPSSLLCLVHSPYIYVYVWLYRYSLHLVCLSWLIYNSYDFSFICFVYLCRHLGLGLDIYIYAYSCIYMHTYVYLCTFVYIYAYVCIFLCIYVCIIHNLMYVCMHENTYIKIHIRCRM